MRACPNSGPCFQIEKTSRADTAAKECFGARREQRAKIEARSGEADDRRLGEEEGFAGREAKFYLAGFEGLPLGMSGCDPPADRSQHESFGGGSFRAVHRSFAGVPSSGVRATYGHQSERARHFLIQSGPLRRAPSTCTTYMPPSRITDHSAIPAHPRHSE